MDADAHLVGIEVTRLEEAHVVGGHHRGVGFQRQVHGFMYIAFLVFAAGALQFEVVAVAEGRLPFLQQLFGFIIVARDQRAADIAIAAAGECDQAIAVLMDPFALHHRDAARLAFEVAFRDQLRQVQVTVVVLAQQQHAVRLQLAVGIADPGIDADHRLDAGAERGLVELDHREQVGLVGQCHRRHVLPGELLHQRLDADGTVDERVFGVQA